MNAPAKVGPVLAADAGVLEQLKAFWAILKELAEDDDQADLLAHASVFMNLGDDDDLTHDQSTDLGETVVAIEDALNEVAPPYCYFGQAGHGEGDYGFWPDVHAVDADSADHEVIKVSEVPSFLMHVNDHGNVTLYRVTVKEVWSVV